MIIIPPKDEIDRRLVVSDIHGCFKSLKTLIENRIALTKRDLIIFLGDYIDRGPNSSGVLDYIIGLINEGYNIFPLRGNHEQNLLDAVNEYDIDTLAHYVGKISKSPDLLDETKNVKSKYVKFMEKLEFYFELDNFIIVHAGINFKAENPYEDKVSMLELRTALPSANGKILIHGHQVTPLYEIVKAIDQRSSVLPLDNGCFYTKPHKIYDHTQTGNLCCLNLDTFELIVQRNVE
jgi:serine/threonine protein phosphatase 1